MSIGFTVTIVPEAAKNGVRLCDAWMQFDGDASGVGSYAEVIEHLIAPPAEEMVGALEVYDRVTLEGDEITRRKDALEFCGPDGFGAVSSLIVEKTATFFARPVGGVASASLIEQRFSEVPSPGALALAGLAARPREKGTDFRENCAAPLDGALFRVTFQKFHGVLSAEHAPQCPKQ